MIEFHVLESHQETVWLHYVCSLAAQHHAAHKSVVIVCDDQSILNRVDEHLWTFSEDSFIPHDQLSPSQNSTLPNVIGLSLKSLPSDVLIHLGFDPLVEPGSHALIQDIIDADPKRRDAGRARFSAYRKQGITPNTLKNPPLP